ncbi:MAG TPA: hypothetical protein VF160_04255 [Candidatus Dormibacteraeota bacterium]
MTTTDAGCRQLVSNFISAREDPEADALALMAESFTFQSPLMRFDDRGAYLESHRSFQRLVRGKTVISGLYGPDDAILLYDLETATPVGVQTTAEHLRFVEGKVAGIVLLFDSAPWRPVFEHLGRRSPTLYARSRRGEDTRPGSG